MSVFYAFLILSKLILTTFTYCIVHRSVPNTCAPDFFNFHQREGASTSEKSSSRNASSDKIAAYTSHVLCACTRGLSCSLGTLSHLLSFLWWHKGCFTIQGSPWQRSAASLSYIRESTLTQGEFILVQYLARQLFRHSHFPAARKTFTTRFFFFSLYLAACNHRPRYPDDLHFC